MEFVFRNQHRLSLDFLVDLHSHLQEQNEYIKKCISWRTAIDQRLSEFTKTRTDYFPSQKVRETLYQFQLETKGLDKLFYLDTHLIIGIKHVSTDNTSIHYMSIKNASLVDTTDTSVIDLKWTAVYNGPIRFQSMGPRVSHFGGVCQACLEQQPNQLAHMEPGGCLFMGYLDFSAIDHDTPRVLGSCYFDDKKLINLSKQLDLTTLETVDLLTVLTEL